MNEASHRVAVVGSGIFGAVTALELQSRGHDVVLVDRAEVPHVDASSTDISKMIRMDYGSDVFYHELAEASLEGWERWNSDWPRRLYHDEGFLVLSSGPMRPGGFEHESHRVLVERGYTPERVDARTLATRFPAWHPERYPDGYLSPRGGWAESGAVVAHLLDECRAAGVDLIVEGVSEIVEDGGRVTGVRLGRSQGRGAVLPADHVVLAVGAWTASLVPELDGTLVTVAQPVLHFGVEDPDQFRGPHFPPFAADIAGSGWYGFPALADGRVKLGHHGAGRVVPPDERGEVGTDHVERARAFLRESIPGLADAPVVGTRICLYCDSFDGDLLIDRHPRCSGLTVAAGGSGHGFKFAPVLGGIIADVVEGRDNRWRGRFRWRSTGASRKEAARMQVTDTSSPPNQGERAP